MKGVVVAKAGGAYEVVDAIEKPKPGKNQILVKSLVTGINPIENYMQGAGLFVESWPIVLGCDASGVVVEVGEGTKKFKVGDGAFGCTRLGFHGYATFQEYFLMDEHLAFKRPKNISVEQAATLGVGYLTAALGLISGTKLTLPSQPSAKNGQWIAVLGAAGGVGQCAIQIAKLCGFKVLASCSPSSNKLVESVGADATLNYRTSVQEQVDEIGRITGGKIARVIDTSAKATETGMAALAKYSDPEAGGKWFTTVNDWDPLESKDGITVYLIKLGEIGRSGDAKAEEVNEDLTNLIPKIEKLVENGHLKPMEYEIVGTGFDGVLKGIEVLNSNKGGGKKIIVKLQSE